MITKKDYESLIQLSLNHPDGTSYQPVETLPDGRKLCLVIGWQVGYDEGEDYQLKVGNTLYTLCEKLAVNVDDLQCDYGVDWYEPWDKKTGDVWMTDQSVVKDDDVDWINEQAKEIKEAFERGELEVE